VADEDIRILLHAILDYFEELKPVEKPSDGQLKERYAQILIEFLLYALRKDIAWKDMFTFDTFRAFRRNAGCKNTSRALMSLSEYLYEKGSIDQPLEIPSYQVQLPPLYEHYLCYLKHAKAASPIQLRSSRRVLASLHGYLENHKIALSTLKIEHLDAFLAEFTTPFSPVTCKVYRGRLRGFLQYLYYERGVGGKDLAPLLVGPPVFTQSNPPKFLRPEDIHTLFASLKLNGPTQIRTYAMIHLAYSLGLRPVEISRITLDDISFKKGELTVPNRKTTNPVILPIPDKTLKAIAAYALKLRPPTAHRALFLSSYAPYKPVSSGVVIYHISEAMKEAGLSSTPYWLRHSYAQNLLQIGRSIYEIKEMMGHENIRSTQRYLHIHTELMRKLLFHETL
jgi:integrase/recombinase XerD